MEQAQDLKKYLTACSIVTLEKGPKDTSKLIFTALLDVFIHDRMSSICLHADIHKASQLLRLVPTKHFTTVITYHLQDCNSCSPLHWSSKEICTILADPDPSSAFASTWNVVNPFWTAQVSQAPLLLLFWHAHKRFTPFSWVILK